MDLGLTVNGQTIQLTIGGLDSDIYQRASSLLQQGLSHPKVKNREAICRTYSMLVENAPTANPSDLWHHVVYRLYCDVFNQFHPQDPKQSWVRASGDALEIFVENLYRDRLAQEEIKIRALLSSKVKSAVLTEMKLSNTVGSDKLDVALWRKTKANGWEVYGGVHVKASLAERISDDIPCSRAMMESGLWSPLWTLDVKSFPPPTGDLINRGELGTPEKPSEKRKYIEKHGDFDNCYSANVRSQPSSTLTPSGKRVEVMTFSAQPDSFLVEAIRRGRT